MEIQLKKVEWGRNSFEIGLYPVTQEQWIAVMGINPSYFKECPKCPVEQVNWDDVQDFLSKLNHMTGQNYRLPTEAEWEYAARGGEAGAKDDFLYSGSNDIDAVAWHGDNSNGRTHEVGQKQPNQLGLYDMSGNVWEWVQDCWHKNYKGPTEDGSAWLEDNDGDCSLRVIRGGSWYSNSEFYRVANRYFNNPRNRNISNGFRLARGGSWVDDVIGCRSSLRSWSKTDIRGSINGFRLAH